MGSRLVAILVDVFEVEMVIVMVMVMMMVMVMVMVMVLLLLLLFEVVKSCSRKLYSRCVSVLESVAKGEDWEDSQALLVLVRKH